MGRRVRRSFDDKLTPSTWTFSLGIGIACVAAVLNGIGRAVSQRSVMSVFSWKENVNTEAASCNVYSFSITGISSLAVMYQVVYKSQHSDRSALCFCEHSFINDSVDESLERYTRLFWHLGLGISISAHFSINLLLSVSLMALKNSLMVDWCIGVVMRDGLGVVISDGLGVVISDVLPCFVSR